MSEIEETQMLQTTSSAPDHGVGVSVPAAVSGFAASLATFFGWAINAPASVTGCLVAGVGPLTGVLTIAWLKHRHAKQHAAELRRKRAAERRKRTSKRATSKSARKRRHASKR